MVCMGNPLQIAFWMGAGVPAARMFPGSFQAVKISEGGERSKKNLTAPAGNGI
jgi:hypothetical protein